MAFVVLFVAGLVVAAVLAAYPRSRPVGLALLGAGAALTVVVVLLALWVTPGEMRPPRELTIADGPQTAGSAPVAEIETLVVGQPADASQPSGRVFKALGSALAEAFKQTSEEKKTAAAAAEPVASEPPANWYDIPPSANWAIVDEGREDDVYRVEMVIGSCENRAECDARLPEAIEAGLLAFAERWRPEGAGKVRFSPEGFEHRVVCTDTRELTYHSEHAGPRTQLHVGLQFDQDLLRDVQDRWTQAMVTQRLWYTGAGMIVLLGLLAVVYFGLVLDRATGGRRRIRLGFAAAAAAVVVLFVAAMLLDAAG
jgi:hypothetical protein